MLDRALRSATFPAIHRATYQATSRYGRKRKSSTGKIVHWYLRRIIIRSNLHDCSPSGRTVSRSDAPDLWRIAIRKVPGHNSERLDEPSSRCCHSLHFKASSTGRYRLHAYTVEFKMLSCEMWLSNKDPLVAPVLD